MSGFKSSMLYHPFWNSVFKESFGRKGIIVVAVSHVLSFAAFLIFFGSFGIELVILSAILSLVFGGLLGAISCQATALLYFGLKRKTKFPWIWLLLAMTFLLIAWLGYELDQGKVGILGIPRDLGLYLLFGGLFGAYYLTLCSWHKVEQKLILEKIWGPVIETNE